MDRISKIRQYKINKDLEEKQKLIDKQNRIDNLKEQILGLSERMDSLYEVGNACLENGIRLSPNYVGNGKHNYDNDYFITCTWAHLVGFLIDHNRVVGFGKLGGGACSFNLQIYKNNNGYVIDSKKDSSEEYALQEFINKFDEFETKFYRYVDRVIG